MQVENITRGLLAETVAFAALKKVNGESLVAADEEGYLLVSIQSLNPQHELVELFQGVVVSAIIECLVVTMTDVDTYDEVGFSAHAADHPFSFVNNLLLRLENVAQLFLRLSQVPCIIHGVPPLPETKKLEDSVPPLVMGDFPRQSLVVVPAVAALQIPLLIERKIDERAMQQVGEVFDSPVEEDNHHPLLLGYASCYRCYIGPQTVARLSGGIANDSHCLIFGQR